MRKIFIAILFALALAFPLPIFAQLDTSAFGSPTDVKLNQTSPNNVVVKQEATFATYSTLHTIATTTAGGIAVTPLTGRDYIEIRVASITPAFYLVVSIGSTTANIDASNTVTVDYYNPLKLNLPDTVPMGIIASDALKHTIFQGAY